MQNSTKCVFSVDVEDWFHILDVAGAPDIASWSNLSSRVEANFLRLLDIFSTENRRVTCFFLGWIAEHFPHLVREAAARGHEIASHGYSHQLVYRMNQSEFRQDIRRSRSLLEDITGSAVIGYRAPGFSSSESTPWFFEEVSNSGYLYDSSVFPARHGHGGDRNGLTQPHYLLSGHLVEFPVSVSTIGPMRVCLFGGGYLRLFPYSLIRYMGMRNLDRGIPLIFYIHPREIDPHHPRIPMSLRRRFKSYLNLDSTENKIRRISRDFPISTFRDYLSACAPETNSELAMSA